MSKQFIILLLGLLLQTGLAAQALRLSLDEAIRQAKIKNRQLHAQQLEEQLAALKTSQIKGQMLPTISASGSYQYNFDRQAIFMPGSFVGNDDQPVVDLAVGGKHAMNTSISITQPLLNKSTRLQLEMSKINEEVQQQKTQDFHNQLAVNVSIAYLNIQLLQEQIALHEQSLLRNQRALEDSRALFRQGKHLKVDTLRNYITVENLKSTISYLKNDQEVLTLQFKRWVGLAPEVTLELSDPIVEPVQLQVPTDLNNAVELALRYRKDIRVQELSILLHEQQINLAQSQKAPQLLAVGMYQIQSQADNLKLGQYNFPRTSFLGIQASFPIYSGNRLNSGISQSKLRLLQSEIALTDLRDKVRTELAATLSKLNEARTQLDIHQQRVAAAELSYAMMNERYRNGLGTRIELVDAEFAFTQAKLHHLQAIHRMRLLQIEFQQNTGSI